MARVKGWDARDAQFQAHRALLNESDDGDRVSYRWECTCRRDGRWTTDKAAAEKGALTHERRFIAKPQGPKGLRKLLTLG